MTSGADFTWKLYRYPGGRGVYLQQHSIFYNTDQDRRNDLNAGIPWDYNAGEYTTPNTRENFLTYNDDQAMEHGLRKEDFSSSINLVGSNDAYSFAAAHNVPGGTEGVHWATWNFRSGNQWVPAAAPAGAIVLPLGGSNTKDARAALILESLQMLRRVQVLKAAYNKYLKSESNYNDVHNVEVRYRELVDLFLQYGDTDGFTADDHYQTARNEFEGAGR
jgi:hypothetical protein